MDNPQHYQPLSHALHPPLHRSPQQYSSYAPPAQEFSTNGNRREEEEEEEEEVVEEELDDTDRRDHSAHSSPQNRPNAGPAAATNLAPTEGSSTPATRPLNPDTEGTEGKRRPGRPKGSRNRKPRESGGSVAKSQFQSPPSGAPQLPGVTPQNQQYYEFQWRVLNLCSEFYGAAEELVKGTPSMVIAQSYQMGPTSKVDPLNMLNEAKRICDQLLQNPSQLVGQTPPTIYPAMPYPAPIPSASASAPPATTNQASPVITNPQTFVMSLGVPGATQPMYPTMYAAPSRYPTAPYYQYAAPPGYFSPVPPQPQPTTSASAPAQYLSPAPTGAAQTTATTINMSASNPGGASGAWADDEVEKLKKFAEEGRARGTNGEIDWDWIVGQWGNSRTRHQILLKATSLGLKESTTRGVKRRREAESTPAAAGESSGSAGAHINAPSNSGGTLASPAQSHTTASTPSAQPSPAIQYRPPSSQAHPRQSTSSTPATSRPTTATQPTTASNMPWPMPTVAAANAPVITSSGDSQTEPQRTSYYRQRQSTGSNAKPSPSAGPAATHSYMYQPNGSGAGSRDSRA